LQSIAKDLLNQKIFPYIENSRRGGHLWLFFKFPIPGSDARSFGRGLQAYYQISEVELFPKQDSLKNGPGSLIRMPFGIHRKSGKRYGFCTAEGNPIAPTISEQILVLANPFTVSQEQVQYYQAYDPSMKSETLDKQSDQSKEFLSNKIKAKIRAIDFIGEYVRLKPTPSGGVGLCPFHDDHNSSFGVNASENYWFCFAGCGGGSIIDFWMKWKETDFKEAVKELAFMLLK
jgi:hypothetical protein